MHFWFVVHQVQFVVLLSLYVAAETAVSHAESSLSEVSCRKQKSRPLTMEHFGSFAKASAASCKVSSNLRSCRQGVCQQCMLDMHVQKRSL